MAIVRVARWLWTRRDRRRAAIERELNRKQLEIRATILRLATELGGDHHEARKALIRASYLASGNAEVDQ